jgi:hypothetical protein
VYYYNFAHEGDPAANIDVRVEPRSTPIEPAGLALSVGPQPGWESTALRLALRAPAGPQPGESPARILIEIADVAPYPFSLRVTDDGYRVVELEGLAEAGLGGSTIPLQLEVVPETATEWLALRATTRWHSPDGTLVEASFTDRLSMPVTR